MDEAEPKGLNLSLDDIIKSSRDTNKPRNDRFQHNDTQQRYNNNGSERGGVGPAARHRHNDHGYQHQHQPYQKNRIFHGHHHNNNYNNHREYRERHHHHHHRPARREIDYRELQKCSSDVTGTVVVEYNRNEIVRITPAGDITLNANGNYDEATFASINDALTPLGIKVTAPGGDISTGVWSISGGKSLIRYVDGVVLSGKGDTGRGQLVADAFRNPAAAAATAASNAAAMNAGLMMANGGGGGGLHFGFTHAPYAPFAHAPPAPPPPPSYPSPYQQQQQFSGNTMFGGGRGRGGGRFYSPY